MRTKQPNPVAARISRVVAAGVPAGLLTSTVQLYQAPSGKLYHGSHNCSKLRDYTNRVQVRALDLPNAKLCSCLTALPPGPVEAYLQQAELVLATRKTLGAEGAATLDGLSTLKRAAKQLNELAGSADASIAPLLRETARSATLVLEGEEYGRLGRAARQISTHRCARENLQQKSPLSGGGNLPPLRDEDLTPFQQESYSSLGTRVHAAAWKAWGEALDQGGAPETARTEAVAAAKKAAGDEPAALRQLPKTFRYRGGDFESPQAWATAEWLAYRDEQLETTVARWEKEVGEAAKDVSPTCGSVLVVDVTQKDTPRAGERTRALNLLGTFDSVEAGGHHLVMVPAAVAEWFMNLSKRTGSSWGTPPYRAKVLSPAAEGDTQATLETALALWREDPERRGIEHHLELARLALA